VTTNFFAVTKLSATSAYQYSVQIVPLIAKEKARRVFRQCEARIKAQYPHCWLAYDGLSTAYSSSLIPDWECDQVPVPFEEDLVLADVGNGRGNRQSIQHQSLPEPTIMELGDPRCSRAPVRVSIRKVAHIDFATLMKTAGKGSDNELVLNAAQCLSVVLRYVPSLLYVPVDSNFFASDNRVALSGGLEVWRGYHQSVRAVMAGHLGINVDVVSTVMRKGGMDLIDYLMETGGYSSVQSIADSDPKALESLLKGCSVVTTHRGDNRIRFPIKSVRQDNSITHLFNHNGTMISVYDYYQQQYGIRLQFPRLPVIGKVIFI
jgi:eukaryotic translation initiation factor 2C